MTNLYCPKCGQTLIISDFNNYLCPSKECNYTLKNQGIIDISFKSKGIAKALSNLCNYPFYFNHIEIQSMESFIQSLKIENTIVQADLCSKSGLFCVNMRPMLQDWKKTQNVFWKGKKINRQSTEYLTLLIDAYSELYDQSPFFRYALEQSKGYILEHSIGCTDKTKTLLTQQEFIDILYHLRG